MNVSYWPVKLLDLNNLVLSNKTFATSFNMTNHEKESLMESVTHVQTKDGSWNNVNFLRNMDFLK